MVVSYTADVGSKPEPVVRSDRSLKRVRSGCPLCNVEPWGKGVRDALLFR